MKILGIKIGSYEDAQRACIVFDQTEEGIEKIISEVKEFVMSNMPKDGVRDYHKELKEKLSAIASNSEGSEEDFKIEVGTDWVGESEVIDVEVFEFEVNKLFEIW